MPCHENRWLLQSSKAESKQSPKYSELDAFGCKGYQRITLHWGVTFSPLLPGGVRAEVGGLLSSSERLHACLPACLAKLGLSVFISSSFSSSILHDHQHQQTHSGFLSCLLWSWYLTICLFVCVRNKHWQRTSLLVLLSTCISSIITLDGWITALSNIRISKWEGFP